MTTTALHYTYVSGTLDTIQKAWHDFTHDAGQPASQDREVHFIPAIGGCFVVLRDLGSSSSTALAALTKLMPSKGDSPEEALERFKLRCESQVAPR